LANLFRSASPTTNPGKLGLSTDGLERIIDRMKTEPLDRTFFRNGGIWAGACVALGAMAINCGLDESGTVQPTPTGTSSGDGGASSSSSSGTAMGGSGGSGAMGGASGAAGAGGNATCGGGLTDCNGTCVDTTSNPAHCGACGTACSSDLECKNGHCKAITPVCTAGAMEACYSGPVGTANVGPCLEGTHTCLDNETGYGPCEGEVLPVDEVCGNELDEDCDGLAANGASCLTNSGLVVRYVLNEAASGQTPTTALDSAPSPLHLSVDYNGENNMNYVEASTGRGLHWDNAESSGGAAAPVDGTKVHSALHGKTQATIEVVAEIDGVAGSNSRFVHIGAGTESGRFTISSSVNNRVQFRWLGSTIARDWPLNYASSGRCVMHVVFDTTNATAVDRVRLFVNGTLVTTNMGMPPGPNATIDIGPGRSLYLGNRDPFERSFAGSLYYAAIYDRPLTLTEIETHVEYLIVHDD